MNPVQPICTTEWLAAVAAARGRTTLPTGWLYAVRSTGVVCRPGCRSRRPRAANVVLPLTLSAARAQGFRPRKRCRPEVLP